MNHIFPITERDWTEDFPDENGNYMHVCRDCDQVFYGNKRRPSLCKKCSVVAKAKWDALTQEQRDIENINAENELKRIFSELK